MSAINLVLPMFVMVMLTASTLVIMFRRRVQAVRGKQVTMAYYSTYQGGAEPEHAAQASRHFTNLFEAPTLFYVACVTAIATHQITAAIVVVAWAYVVARLIHSYIHLGTNRIGNRIRAYFGSWILLVALWILVVVGQR